MTQATTDPAYGTGRTPFSRGPRIQWGIIALCLLGCAVLFMTFFMQFPEEGRLGIDLIFGAVDDWQITYTGRDGLKNPPWSVIVLMPFAEALPSHAAWGLLVLFTLLVTIVSVPRTRKTRLYWLAVFLLIFSFPSLRNIADGNSEGLVLAGLLLTLAGYQRQAPWMLAAGVLLATNKPQSVSLVMVMVGIYVLQTWPVRKWLAFGVAVLAVVIPVMLWVGGDWLNAIGSQYQSGSLIDMSLSATLRRIGIQSQPVIWLGMALVFAVTAVVVWFSKRDLTREKTGMVICASLLLAPYAAGNSLFNVLAVGIIPLFLARPWLGAALIAMTNIMILLPFEFQYYHQHSYWTVFLLLTWGILNWRIYRQEMSTAGGSVGAFTQTASAS